MSKTTKRPLNQIALGDRNSILNKEGACFGQVSEVTLYCMKHWNESSEEISDQWNNKLERKIYTEEPQSSHRFVERILQYQFMQTSASFPFIKPIRISPEESFVESLFGPGNTSTPSTESKIKGLSFPLDYSNHIIAIIKRADGYLIDNSNDPQKRLIYARTAEDADKIINAYAREKNQSLTNFTVVAMDEYLKSLGVIEDNGTPKRKDNKFPEKLSPDKMFALHDAIANYNDRNLQNELDGLKVEELNNMDRLIEYAVLKDNGYAVNAFIDKGVYAPPSLIDTAASKNRYRSLDALFKTNPDFSMNLLTQLTPRQIQHISGIIPELLSRKDANGKTLAHKLSENDTPRATLMLQTLLDEAPDLAREKDSSEKTPDQYAIINEDIEKIKMFLKKDIQIDLSLNKKNKAFIMRLTEDFLASPEAHKESPQLIEKIHNLLKENADNGEPLLLKIIHKDPNNIEKLLRLYPNLLKEELNNGQTLFQYTLSKNDIRTLEMLLNPELKLDKTILTDLDNRGMALPHYVALRGEYEMLKMLLDLYPDLAELKNNDGESVAYIASGSAKINKADLNKLTELLEFSNDADIPNHIDPESKKPKTPEFLLDTYQDLALLKNNNEEIFCQKVKFAEFTDDPRLNELLKLLDKPILINTNSYGAPNYISLGSKPKTLEFLLDTYPELANITDAKGKNIAHHITSLGGAGTIEILIKHITSLDKSIWTTKDENGITPTSYLELLRDASMLGVLLDTYPDLVNLKDNYGKTLAYTIAERTLYLTYNERERSNNEKKLELLLKHISHIDNSTWSYVSPEMPKPLIHQIAAKGKTRILNMILDNGADTNTPYFGQMPLETAINAATENNLSTIKTLINHGAKIDQNDDGTLDYKINFFQNEIKQASA
nr:hypothetical protein [Rickettsiaceae bacterium]